MARAAGDDCVVWIPARLWRPQSSPVRDGGLLASLIRRVSESLPESVKGSQRNKVYSPYSTARREQATSAQLDETKRGRTLQARRCDASPVADI
jgi:hypothetical protein